jgi:MYXO-CTERM domain-containing protein
MLWEALAQEGVGTEHGAELATVGVVNRGPSELDADAPLSAATFTLPLSGGCGCAAGDGPSGAWIWVIGGLVGVRRRRIQTR